MDNHGRLFSQPRFICRANRMQFVAARVLRAALLPISSGSHTESGLEHSGKMTLVGKPGIERGIYDGMALSQQLSGMFETQLKQIGVGGDAFGGAKKTNQVVAGALQEPGDLVEGDLAIDIGEKIIDDRLDPLSLGGGGKRFMVLLDSKQATEAGQEIDFRLQSGGGMQQGIVQFDKQPPEMEIRDDAGWQSPHSSATSCYLFGNTGQKTFRKVKTSQMAVARPAGTVCVNYSRLNDGEVTWLQYFCRTVQGEFFAA